MTKQLQMNRRQFVVTTAAIGGGMALGVLPGGANALAAQIDTTPWVPTRPAGGTEITPWIVIGADDTIVIRVSQSEMGQQTFTSSALMVCEELECDWSKVKAEYVDVNRHWRENQVYQRMSTSASAHVRVAREYLQQAGASARERLKTVAAQQWNVPVAEVEAKESKLTHRASGRTLRYGEVAARAATVKMAQEPLIKMVGEFTRFGKSTKLLETPLRVNGSAVYSIDVKVPGMVHAAIKQSPVFLGKVKSFDFNAIKDRPGVIAAVDFGGGATEAGVAVVADHFWQAKSALEVLPIEWDEGPNGKTSSEQFFAAGHAALSQPGKVAVTRGNAAAALKSSKKVVEAIYEVPFLDHATMEPYGVTVQLTPDRADVWAGTQNAPPAAQDIANITKLPLDKVYMHTTFLGGGYGRRLQNDDVRQAVEIAQKVKRTVKVIWTREEVTRHGRYRPMRMAKFEAGLDDNGRMTAWLNRMVQWTQVAPAANNAGDVFGLHEVPYAVPNFLLDVHMLTNHVPNGSMIAVGRSQNDYFMEVFIDEVAYAAGRDPYRYRVETLMANPEFRQAGRWVKALHAVAKKANWGSPLPKGWGRGIAIADGRRFFPTNQNITICAVVATVEVSKDGALKIHNYDVVFDTGASLINTNATDQQIHNQIVTGTQVATDLEITIRNGRAVQGNFDDYPMMRIADMPNIKIDYISTTADEWIGGVGQEAVTLPAPAVTNAIFAATGKRIRSLPIRNHDLSWS